MNQTTRRALVWLSLGLVAAALLAWSFWPQAVPVEIASVTRGPLRIEVPLRMASGVSDEIHKRRTGLAHRAAS